MQKIWDCNDDSIKFIYCYMALLSVRNYWRITNNKIFDNIIRSGAIHLCMNYFGAIETRLKTNYCLKQFVKMVKDGQHAGSKTNFPCDATFNNFRNGRQEKVNTPDLNVKICCNRDQKKKITNTVINKQCWLDFLGLESIGYIEPNILLCSIYMDSVILLSVFNLLREVGVSVIFILKRFTPDLPGVF